MDAGRCPWVLLFGLEAQIPADCDPDLHPVSRTTVKFAESITMENDGHEDESI